MMALDMALLRKLAAEKARSGKPKGKKAPPEPDADDKAAAEPEKPGSAPTVNPFAAAAAKAKERLLAAK
jgi:hypothetical protein